MDRRVAARVGELKKALDRTRLPRHVAIIMDGNRRWAREHRVVAALGHRAGARALRNTVEACADLGVKVLTAYAFSRENWQRAREEIDTLLFLFEYYVKKERATLHENGIRFQVIGDLEAMPTRLQREFHKTIELTARNRKLIFNLAVNYGARTELVEAVRAIAGKVKRDLLPVEKISDEVVTEHLFTHGLPDPDLLIRTSGEQRISNFLLWQMAYTEFWFTPTYWPDFTPADLLAAILEYQQRKRRFGGN